jgi:IclR family mhp operon transcriptional activator
MIIQESTNARSPLSLDPDRIGGRFPVLASAAGRAFLAACDPQQRKIVLEHLPLLGDPADLVHLKDAAYEALLNSTVETREDDPGVAFRCAGSTVHSICRRPSISYFPR